MKNRSLDPFHWLLSMQLQLVESGYFYGYNSCSSFHSSWSLSLSSSLLGRRLSGTSMLLCTRSTITSRARAALLASNRQGAEAIGNHLEASAALGGGDERLSSDAPALTSASRAGHDGNSSRAVTSEEVSADRNETRSGLGDEGVMASSGRGQHQQEIIGGDTSSDSEEE